MFSVIYHLWQCKKSLDGTSGFNNCWSYLIRKNRRWGGYLLPRHPNAKDSYKERTSPQEAKFQFLSCFAHVIFLMLLSNRHRYLFPTHIFDKITLEYLAGQLAEISFKLWGYFQLRSGSPGFSFYFVACSAHCWEALGMHSPVLCSAGVLCTDVVLSKPRLCGGDVQWDRRC